MHVIKTHVFTSNYIIIDVNIGMYSETYTKKHYHYHNLIPLIKYAIRAIRVIKT